MEESLRCVNCFNFAVDAVSSDCDCQLIYCLKCSRGMWKCGQCQTKFRDSDIEGGEARKETIGFSVNKLARRLLATMKLPCPTEGCEEVLQLDRHAKHWRSCKERAYICALCDQVNLD